MIRRILFITILAVSAAIGSNSIPSANATTQPSAGTTWDAYSLMFSRSAGQFYSGKDIGGQWAWRPQSNTVSDIAWGDPRSWPPASAERFVRSNDGNWVLLEGFSRGQNQPVTQVQRVTSEHIGDAQCGNMKPLPSDGNRQHYVKWHIPQQGYCLDAVGTIKSPNNSTTVNFRHRQKWSPPTPCSNDFMRNQTCIIQQEEWWDDNGRPYNLRLNRTQHIARGLGMAFKVVQTYPSPWSAGTKYYWNW